MYVLSDETLLHDENEEHFVVNVNTGKVFKLNEMAHIIISEIKSGNNLESICKNIRHIFNDITIDELTNDVTNYINSLVDNQIVIAID